MHVVCKYSEMDLSYFVLHQLLFLFLFLLQKCLVPPNRVQRHHLVQRYYQLHIHHQIHIYHQVQT